MKRRMIWIAPLAILAMVLFVTLGGYVVDASLELVAAWVVWLAADYFLARAWTAGIVPDTLWRDSGCMGRAALIFGGACASAAGA